MTMEKTHIYVPVEFAKKYNELDDAKAQAKIAIEIIEAKKLNISDELECLNDDVIQFKAACLSYKAELKKAYDEQSLVVETLVNDVISAMPSIRAHAVTLAKEIEPVKSDLESMKGTMDDIKKFSDSVSFWGAEKLLDLVTQINNMDDKSKDVFKFLMANYKDEA